MFQQRYGDGFVRGMQTGGEVFAVISVTSSSKEQASIAASLQAKYGGLFASVEVDVSPDSKTKSQISGSKLSVSTYQKGGTGDDQSLTADIESVMARLKAFPQNDIEFLQLHPEYFENPPDITILNKWQDFVVSEINQLIRQASKCVDNPVGGCPLIAFQLPADFRQVQRKLLNSIDIKAAAQSWPNNVVMRNVDTPKDFTVSTRLVTQFTQQTVPGFFGVGLVLGCHPESCVKGR